MTSRVTLTVMGFLLLMRCTVHALQAYQSSIPNGANVVRNGASWPGVGHVTAAGGTANNQFGLDFASAGHSWTTSLCNKDSDGDGYSNGMELGDPNCVWSSGATPSRTTGISHPGFSDSTPTVATTTTTTTTTAAPPTTTTTAAPPTTTTTAAPPTTTTTAAPPTTTTTAAPPTTTTTAAPTTTTTTAAPTVAPTTTAAPPGVTTTTTAAPPTTTTTPSPPTPTTASPPTTTTTSAPPGATTPQPTPAPVTSKVTTTPAPPGVTTKAPVTLFAGPSGPSGLTTSTLTSTPRITARVGPTPSSAIGSTGASSVTTDGADQATTTDGLTAPPGSPVTTAANASLGDGATTAPISSSAEVVAAITAPVTVLGGAMRFNWTIFRPVVNRQRRSAASSDVVDMAIHSASATEYVGFGVSASLMTGALVACYVGSTVAGNTIVRCLSGTGDGLSATFSTPSTTTVQVLSWSVSANGGFDVTMRCSASALGLVAGSRQRLIVSHGTVMATQDLVLGHGTSSTDRDELVIDAYAGTSTTADDSSNQWIATYITIAVCLVTLVVAGAMNAARIVLGPSASSAARLSVMFLFLGLLGLYIGMSHRDHDRNLKSTPVGRAFGDGAVFCLWFVLYPVPKHVSVGTVAGSSFERLITYHSTIGMMLFVVSTVHVATMLSLESDIATRVFTWQGDQPILAGLVAWICIVLMVLTAFLRRWVYALFRLVHLLALPTIIFACLHYPPLVLALIPPLLNVAVDLCLRLRSHCISAPVVTRVPARPSHVMLVLQVPGVKSVPAGSFVNLGVSASGCIGYPHPVSVAWFDETTHEATFLIRPMSSTGSWSATLHERACVSASDVFGSRVSWQGPYGALQVPLGSTPGVLLVAGGIGVTPMLSILQRILATPQQEVQRVVLMWSLKACEYELRADVEDLLAQCVKTSTVDLGIVFFLTGGAAVSTNRGGDGSVVALRRRMDAAVDIPTVVQLLRNSVPLAASMPQLDGVPSKSPRAKHYANVDAAVVDVEPSITDLPLAMYCCGPASLMSACYREAAATRGMKYHEETFDL